MPLIRFGRKASIRCRIFARKAITCTGAGLKLSPFEPGSGQPFYLHPRIATDMCHEAEQQSFIGL